jgi:hypothetical protein
MKTIKIGIPSIVLLILISSFVCASEFSIISATSLSSGTPYRGDSISYKGRIQADLDNWCKLECSYQIGSDSGYVSDSGSSPSTQLSAGNIQEFPFDVKTSGSSPITLDLIVSCKQVMSLTCLSSGTITHSKQISLFFLYPGDGICTTSKEKCSDYGFYLGTSDCSCPSTKECRPNGPRNPDSKGCQNYCGNGICEKSEGESCIGAS